MFNHKNVMALKTQIQEKVNNLMKLHKYNHTMVLHV